MKLKHLIILSFLANVLSAHAQFPDTAWIYTYGGPGKDYCKDIKATPDGGFILAGTTSSFGAGCSGVYLVKIGSNFQKQWSKAIGGINVEWGQSVATTYDGGYAIAGYTNSRGYGGYDFYLVKTNSTGDTSWTRTYGGSDWDFCYGLYQMADSGFVLAGETYSFGNGLRDAYVVRTDKNGDTLWTRTIGGIKDDAANGVVVRNDTVFICGVTESYGNGGKDLYFAELNGNNGDTLLTRAFGGAADDIGFGLDTSFSHTVALIGSSLSYPSPTGTNAYVLLLDTGGNTLWWHVHGGAQEDIGKKILPTPSGDFLTAGCSNSSGSGGYGLHMMHLNSGGWWLGGPVFGGLYDEEGTGIAYRQAGGVVFAGTSASYGQGQEDMYLIYLKSDSIVMNYTLQVTSYADNLSPLFVSSAPISNENVSVFPNPFSDRASVRLSEDHAHGFHAKVYDVFGRVVLEQDDIHSQEFFLERKDLSPGLYFLELTEKNVPFYTGKLVID